MDTMSNQIKRHRVRWCAGVREEHRPLVSERPGLERSAWPSTSSASTSAFPTYTVINGLARKLRSGLWMVRGTSSLHEPSTKVGQNLFIAMTLSEICRSSAVPPAGFKPALPPLVDRQKLSDRILQANSAGFSNGISDFVQDLYPF